MAIEDMKILYGIYGEEVVGQITLSEELESAIKEGHQFILSGVLLGHDVVGIHLTPKNLLRGE